MVTEMPIQRAALYLQDLKQATSKKISKGIKGQLAYTISWLSSLQRSRSLSLSLSRARSLESHTLGQGGQAFVLDDLTLDLILKTECSQSHIQARTTTAAIQELKR